MTEVFRLQIANLLRLKFLSLRRVDQFIQYESIEILRRSNLSLTRFELQLREA